MSKNKGTRAERELLHMFYDTEKWICLRAPGSGNIPIPSPDLLAGNGIRHLAIECKSVKKNSKYLSKQEITDLKTFANKFGAEPWIGIRFDNIGWYFLTLQDLKKSGKMYAVTLELAKRKGLNFKELIS